MSISEENDEFQQKCEWCGKSGISILWSGKKDKYCSFRCNAAGSHRMYVGISVIFSILTSILGIMYLMMIVTSHTFSVPPILLIMPTLLVVTIMAFIYGSYVGWSMLKERQTSQLAMQ
ncbi:MAG: hypothetical protein KAU48_07155 [Candidatus Thorarchaeota archaeon]|nr:hypothetical protein [Candidatus Thorarchaeota archaeon]